MRAGTSARFWSDVKKLPRAWALAGDVVDTDRALATWPTNKAASTTPPITNLLIRITSVTDITEQEVGRGSSPRNATAPLLKAALAAAALHAEHVHLPPLVGRNLPVMVDVGLVEMRQRHGLRLGERNPPVMVGVGHVEQPRREAHPAHGVHVHPHLVLAGARGAIRSAPHDHYALLAHLALSGHEFLAADAAVMIG